ncbi:MAG TPA: efflux RND transporter periplasmic adaptor subunit [Myxococcota bacterium]|nr:efflux RND transporter periplasmic adaptor subunit [Myxococcota bacterium]
MRLHQALRSRIAAMSALIALSACGQKPPPAAPQPPEVAVVTVRRGPVPLSLELPGRTSAYLVAQVRARVDGIVLKRDFKEGTDVKANQRLYLIDPAPFRAALDSAVATLGQAQANIASTAAQAERFGVLSAGNAVSKQDYDNAVAARDQAVAAVASGKAAVETAKINLGYTQVLSPITGRIGISQVTEGAYVQASAATLMATVQQIDPIYVDLTQSSVEGLRLRRDVASGRLKLQGPDQARVTLILEDGTQYPEKGTLQFTDITVDQTTGSVTVRAIFPNPRHVLLPGMFVRARIDEGVNDGAILVPEVGVTHNPSGQATALVVGPDDKVAVRTIQATRTLGDKWVVEGGLADGERVIVSGGQKVQPGMLVRVAAQAPAAPGPQPAAAKEPATPASASGAQPAAATGPATPTSPSPEERLARSSPTR